MSAPFEPCVPVFPRDRPALAATARPAVPDPPEQIAAQDGRRLTDANRADRDGVQHGIRCFSYGGGVQSTAALVLAARREIDYPTFLFANVGEDSEHPDTLRYVETVAAPYAASEGIELVTLRKTTRDGATQTLMQRIAKTQRSIPIPMRMGKNGAPGNRTCTSEFKIRVIERELRRRGATKEAPATVGLGISIDEFQRVRTAHDSRSPYQLRDYPLIERRLDRQDALNIIASAGLPIPGRSSCYFCPFHTGDEWQRLARTRPELFAKACELEATLHERGQRLGRGEFYLTRHGAPLAAVYDGAQTVLMEDDGCESGYCHT